jgi:endonuclease YncB( thermonuclease family)
MQSPISVDNMRANGVRAPIIAFVVCLASLHVQAADLTGVPRIVDGDTIAIGSTKFRLQGIDAPETDQFCLNANGDHWIYGIWLCA